VKQVKIADLKNNLSRHLQYVRTGGEMVIFDRDLPVARIVPIGARTADPRRRQDDYWTEDRVAHLERQGTLVPGEGRDDGWAARLRPAKLPDGSPSLVDLLLQTRRESTR
jgi:antitoxin (DNA-binding transcriptional repressor) of toxin-antitoxin stability system